MLDSWRQTPTRGQQASPEWRYGARAATAVPPPALRAHIFRALSRAGVVVGDTGFEPVTPRM